MGIHKLPESLSRRIAAGEVIERPVSVVKELVENSLDAGASHVAVELVQGGKVLISVKDDGCGIAPDEMTLAIEKHATSKISTAEDLEAISTLGYRGEALSSVCAVSALEIFSRQADLPEGALLSSTGGNVKVSRMPLQPGTTVVVRDLFFNLPARRKFLKSSISESRRITSLVKDYALAYPNVSFSLINEGKSTFKSPGTGGVDEVLSKVWGTSPEVRYRECTNSKSTTKVWWQDIGPKSRFNLTVFVNGRRVSNGTIRSAITSFAWAGRGNWLVMLTLPAEDIDVNVHPTKAEILLRHPNEVFELVHKATDDFSRKFSSLPLQIRPMGEGTSDLPDVDFSIDIPKPKEQGSHTKNVYCKPEVANPFSRVQSPFERPQSPAAYERPSPRLPFYKPEEMQQVNKAEVEQEKLQDRVYMGQTHQGYLVFSSPEGLLIVDPHAAHERINYERILSMCKDPRGEDMLLMPIPLPPTLKDEALAHKEDLEKLKFKLDDDGNLTALPLHPKAVGLSPIDLLRSAISALEEKSDSALMDVFAVKACKASVKLTTQLEASECYRLLEDLERCKEPNACPHGRPTVLRLSNNALDKHFGRLGL